MPKLQPTTFAGVLIFAGAIAPAQYRPYVCPTPQAAPSGLDSPPLSDNAAAYGGGVALFVGALGLVARLRRR